MGLLSLLLGAVFRGPKPVTKEEGHAIEDSFDKRERDPSFVQLARKKCRQCKQTIVAQGEGRRCPTCQKPIHNGCADPHVTKCGAPASPPYR